MTKLKHYISVIRNQIHNLHSRLHFDHSKAKVEQIHKCIVSYFTGRSVFDGNIRVNEKAKLSLSHQTSKNLVFFPKSAIFAKPTLQIFADDVKCTHGCAVSDLDNNKLFYFMSRGLNLKQARKALVNSFGLEVTHYLKFSLLEN